MKLLKLYTSLACGIVCYGITISTYNVVADYKSGHIITSGSKQKPPMLIAAGSKQKPPMLIAAGSKQKPPMFA